MEGFVPDCFRGCGLQMMCPLCMGIEWSGEGLDRQNRHYLDEYNDGSYAKFDAWFDARL
jgi:hypothetical protein